jgi:peptide/nickel transport system permease protein
VYQTRSGGVIRYLVSRLALVAALLLGLISISFGLVSLIPGDPAVAILGDYASRDEINAVHAQLGLDEPFPRRFADYMIRTLHGDLGESYFTKTSISHEMLVRLPNTLVLVVPGLLLAVVLGTAIGTASAYGRNRLPDRILSVVTSVILSVPEFALALILLFVFFQRLRLAPAPLGMLFPSDIAPQSSTGSLIVDAVQAGAWSTLWSIAAHAALPVITLGIFFAVYFAKAVRTGLSAALRSPQVEFARACGLSEWTVYRYAMADVRRSLLTYWVILFGAALSGAAILESVFSWPGIGGWSLNGVLKVDIPVIQGFVLIMGASTLVAYVLLDVATTLLDPRLRSQMPHRPRGAQPVKS